MGGGDLNTKKSWHPNTMKNQEKVWKAEKVKAEETKKMDELRKEMDQERSREELTRQGQDSGVLEKKPNKNLDWMYKDPHQSVDHEQYLLGKAIDKTFEKIAAEERASMVTTSKNHVEHECIPFSMRNLTLNRTARENQVDMARKLLEDPLVAIRKREAESRSQLLQNPVKLKELSMLLKAEQATRKMKKDKKRGKKSKKDKLEEKIREKLKKLGDDQLDAKLKNLLSSDKASKKSKKRKKSKVSSDSDSDSSDSDSEDNSKKSKSRKSKKVVKKRKQTSDSDSSSESDDHSKERSRKKKLTKEKDTYKHRSSSRGDSVVQSRKSKNKKASKDKKEMKKRQHSSDSDSSSSESDDKPKVSYSRKVHQEKSRDSYNKSSSNNIPQRSEKSHRNMEKEVSRHRDNRPAPDNGHKSLSDHYNTFNLRDDEKHKSYGLIKADGSRIEAKRDPVDNRHDHKSKESEKSWQKPKRSRLTEEEMEKMRREMMQNAVVRDKERESNVRRYRKLDKNEEKPDELKADFVKNQLRVAASQSSVESRIKSNIYNIQRAHGSMDSNFARR